MNNWLKSRQLEIWWRRKLQKQKVQKILNLKVRLRFQIRLKIQLVNLRVWAIAKVKTSLNHMTLTPSKTKAQVPANKLVTLKKVEAFNTGLAKMQSRFLLVFHSHGQKTQAENKMEFCLLMQWKNIWKRKWEELQLLTSHRTRKMMLEALEVILMKILNLFLKVKVINFQVLEVETKNLTLLQLDLLLIITTLVECLISLKNMLKKKINLQWQNKESITLRVRMIPNQHLPKNGLLKETLKTLKF